MGDFIADLNRKRRFDKHFNKCMASNNLSVCENLFAAGELNYTYKKGRTTAYIDHALCRSDNNEFITAYNILNDPEDTSDHQPIRIEIEYDSTSFHVSESALKNSTIIIITKCTSESQLTWNNMFSVTIVSISNF